jgi:hypothetical protein
LFPVWYCAVMHIRSLLLTAALIPAGCVTPPSVQVLDQATITQRTPDASSGTIPVRITNPNSESIKLLEYLYTVHAAGYRTWTGRHAGGIVLSSGFERVAHLPIVLPAGVPPGTKIQIGGALRYLDTSTLSETLADWGYRPAASFSGSAVVTAEK